jgi:hypothetical protein
MPFPHTLYQNWSKPVTFAFIIYPLFYAYNVIYRSSWGQDSLSESLAATAGILLGTSLILASLSYFFDFLDSALSLRKYIGLLGFWLALIYSLTLVLRFPQLYGYGLIDNLGLLEVQLGLAAMLIFGFMTLISTNQGIKILGPIWWRRALRLGFLGYLLLIIRAVDLEGSIWIGWLYNDNLLPPPRLALSIFALLVLFTRLSMTISQAIIQKEDA